MNPLRDALLAGSQSPWLRERATRYGFVRRTVSRFMPGETVDAALPACQGLERDGITSIVTHLGENVSRREEADQVRREYVSLLVEIARRGVDTQISIKPTQLGLDVDPELCFEHVSMLADHAERAGNFLWIDMESTPYVDATLELHRRIRQRCQAVGVCLQAYMRRTPRDLEALLPLGPAIRLVKGAYKEPAELVFPTRREVDEQFFALSVRLLGAEAQRTGSFAGLATHDPALIARLEAFIDEHHVPESAFEFEMLYGIQRSEQRRLVSSRRRVRVLVSYGQYWFPWFMRRLAERPANVWFVVKNLFG